MSQQQLEKNDVFRARKSFSINGKTYNYYSLKALEDAGIGQVSRLPYSIKVLLESVLRQVDGRVITKEHVENLAKWGTDEIKNLDVPFKPSRVILQDFTGVPAVVDLASLRKAMADMGGDPQKSIRKSLLILLSTILFKWIVPEQMMRCNIT